MIAAGFTDVGISRKHNQDAIFVSTEEVGPLPNLFIVADGMGGHNAGDVASSRAIETVVDYVRNFRAATLVLPDDYLDLLVNAAQRANDAIFSEGIGSAEKKGMGTTLTLCVIHGIKILVVHIGDSRAYRVTNGIIEQITTDHTYVEELVQARRISKEQAKTHPRRHVVTRVLGTKGPCRADGLVITKADTKSVLLCSDGLSNMLDNEVILRIVSSSGAPSARALTLISEANKMGGHDNISAIIIDFKEVS